MRGLKNKLKNKLKNTIGVRCGKMSKDAGAWEREHESKGRQQTTNNNQSTTVLGVHKVEHKRKNKLKHTIGVESK